MHASIDRNRSLIADICRRYAVRRLEVFGSAARGADFDPKRSDPSLIRSHWSSRSWWERMRSTFVESDTS